ncbi:protein kinase domain-containing protein [Pontibacter virosus]|uniref:Serine/threonine-protein kinase n=1 Tax=Pontibacter virosus TaxID=1765052 RepID=A0A2U1AVF5_9BACT|nr:protein kinase [Pontibacter virosus]PVY40380.1 serine/threonine-protein kinase [Pontibacter virosus]
MPIYDFSPAFTERFGITGSFKDLKRGGQKTVYFVNQGDKRITLKLFHTASKDARMIRELEIYEKFKDLDGIPKISSIQDFEGEIVVFEEYIEGVTLTDAVSDFIGQDDKVIELTERLVNILTPIWLNDFVHRDIKPDNIILQDGGIPVLLDFGIARDLGADSLTASGFQPHSWPFAAPEQYAGRKELVDYRTDFFSLGVLAYHLYSGTLPFGQTQEEISNCFKSNQQNFSMNEHCRLKPFLAEVLKFSPAERPRLIEQIKSLLR